MYASNSGAESGDGGGHNDDVDVSLWVNISLESKNIHAAADCLAFRDRENGDVLRKQLLFIWISWKKGRRGACVNTYSGCTSRRKYSNSFSNAISDKLLCSGAGASHSMNNNFYHEISPIFVAHTSQR